MSWADDFSKRLQLLQLALDRCDIELAKRGTTASLEALYSHLDAIGTSYCDTCAGPDGVGRERPAAGTPEEYLLTLAYERHLRTHEGFTRGAGAQPGGELRSLLEG